MISRQLTNLNDADYGALKPVYSVWIIINDIPEALQYSRYEVSLTGMSSLKEEAASYSTEHKMKYERAVKQLDNQIDMMHLCLIFLSEDFTDLGETGDTLVRYIQSVFVKKVGDVKYNPYAEYSKSIKKEADEIMTVMRMFEARGEARGIIKSGRHHGFSDAVVIEDIVVQTGCSLQEAEKILHDFDLNIL